ncbi:MAG: 50S ribosomal protein L25, partial [bacterium]
MEILNLQAEPRTVQGRDVNELREKKVIPGIVYGHGFEPRMVSALRPDLEKLLAKGADSTLVNLAIAGDKEPVKVLIAEVQHHPISNLISHVDFHAIRMDEELTVNISLRFIGESVAVKGLGGTLIKTMEHLEARCLPDALIPYFEVDISPLKTFEDKIRISDLKFPSGIEILDQPEAAVCLVMPPRSDEELADLNKAVELDASKVEVAKKEEAPEEGEEGAEAAAPGTAAPAKDDKAPKEEKKEKKK